MSRSLLIVTSIHEDFDKRIWRHAASMVQQGYRVHLVCPWDVQKEEVRDGVVLHPFRRVVKRWQRPYLIPVRVWRCMRSLLAGIDIVHFHDIDLLPWMALVALFKPVVYDVHENYADEMLVRDWVPWYLRQPLYWAVRIGQSLFSRAVKNVVLVTEAQEKDFTASNLNKVIIHNYASLRLLDDVARDYLNRPPAVIFPGSQYVNNGSMLLLEIAGGVVQKLPDVRFLISDAFESERFRRRFLDEVQLRGLSDVIVLLPMVPSMDIVKLLNRATIAVNPVLRVPKQLRAINTKLFEYMAAGLPFVTSDLPYPKALVEGTGAGLVAQPEKPESFVKEICRLLEDRIVASEMGRKGQQHFQIKYSWESQMPVLKAFYEQILGSKSSRHGWRRQL